MHVDFIILRMREVGPEDQDGTENQVEIPRIMVGARIRLGQESGWAANKVGRLLIYTYIYTHMYIYIYIKKN